MKKKLVTFKPKVPMKIKNLSWQQAKERFPLLKPYGNADGDRLTNSRDCKPFDRLRQGEGHKLTQEEIKEINERMMKKMKKRDEEFGFKTEVLDVEKVRGLN